MSFLRREFFDELTYARCVHGVSLGRSPQQKTHEQKYSKHQNTQLLLLLKLLKYFLSATHKLGPALCFATGPAGEGLVEEKAKGQQLDKHWICGKRSFYFTFKIWTKVLKIWCDEKRVVRNVLWYSILFFCWLTHFRELLLFEKSNKGSLRSFKLCAG